MSKKKRGNRRPRIGSSEVSSLRRMLEVDEDSLQLHRTLSLEGVVGDKPCINDIMELMRERLEREHEEEMRRMIENWSQGMIYDCMGEDDCLLDPETMQELYLQSHMSPKHLKALNKRAYKNGIKSQKGSGKKSSKKNRYYYDELLDDDYYEPSEKIIKFYYDIENELNVREFDNLADFESFCADEGYDIPSVDYNNLLNGVEIHCCLDPVDLEYGDKTIITDNSYGGLYWTVNEDVDKYLEVLGKREVAK